MYIVSSGGYCKNAMDGPADLKQAVKQSTGKNVRRVSRFIQLALIGAGNTVDKLADDAGIYLSSGRGDMEVTLDILDEIYLHHQSPRPLNFINSVSNAACFHIATYLNTSGISHFVTSRYLAFETSLHLAYHDIAAKRLTSAIVGAVDAATFPLESHRRRLDLAADCLIAEGSHWVQLAAQTDNSNDIVAKIDAIQQCGELNELLDFLDESLVKKYSRIALGQYMASETREQLLARTKLQLFDYARDIGHFDSQGGLAICRFLAATDLDSLLYIGTDAHDRYIVILLSKPAN